MLVVSYSSFDGFLKASLKASCSIFDMAAPLLCVMLLAHSHLTTQRTLTADRHQVSGPAPGGAGGAHRSSDTLLGLRKIDGDISQLVEM